MLFRALQRQDTSMEGRRMQKQSQRQDWTSLPEAFSASRARLTQAQSRYSPGDHGHTSRTESSLWLSQYASMHLLCQSQL